MNEVVVFCGAYPQVKTALYVLEHNYRTHPTTLAIIGLSDLFKFFKIINERAFQNAINLVFIEAYQPLNDKAVNKIKIMKAFHILPDLVGERRHLAIMFHNHLAGLREAEVFFFSRFFAGMEFYYLRKLDKSNRLVYMQAPVYDSLGVKKSAPTNIRDLAYLARWKLAYGRAIALGKHPLGPRVPLMPDRFFRERVSQVISQEERNAAFGSFDLSRFRVFDVNDYSIMYFQDDLVGGGYISDSEALTKTLQDVFNVIAGHFPKKEVAIKYHPVTAKEEAPLPFGSQLPDFIPAEFLYSEKVKMYLGISSMAIANVEEGTVVSLIDLIKFKDDQTKNGLEEILVRASKTKILFPKSLQEFEQIIAGLA